MQFTTHLNIINESTFSRHRFDTKRLVISTDEGLDLKLCDKTFKEWQKAQSQGGKKQVFFLNRYL